MEPNAVLLDLIAELHARRRAAEVEAERLRRELAEAQAEIERLKRD